jgi:hypothetical protein
MAGLRETWAAEHVTVGYDRNGNVQLRVMIVSGNPNPNSGSANRHYGRMVTIKYTQEQSRDLIKTLARQRRAAEQALAHDYL